MNAPKLDQPGLLDVSPVLEMGSPTTLSTHWIPLHELITHWSNLDLLLLPAPVAPLLTAIGHSLFALSRETRALRLCTLAWQKQQEYAPDAITRSRYAQAMRHLHEAAHHWSRAAFALDTLLPTDLDPAALARAQQLSRIARTQQERLWALTEEVRTEQAGAGSPVQGEVKRLFASRASGDLTLREAAHLRDDSKRERK
jgi:hypothetical protein